MGFINNIDIEKKGNRKILTAHLGQCVHIAGVYNFVSIAAQLGFECNSLSPTTPIEMILNEIKKFKPNIIGLSYRLTPNTINPLLTKFFELYKKLKTKSEKLFFAGTIEVVKIVKKHFKFDAYFIGGESKYKIISILRNDKHNYESKDSIPGDLLGRITWKKPYPVLRAHFGLPGLKNTIKGIEKISNAEILDIISIAPDQNTQENFFHPEKRIKKLSGSGGVPLKNKNDFIKLHSARKTGNEPLLRIYAGTRDFIKLGKLFRDTIKNAWAAIPVFWFNKMDKRGPLSLEASIKLHLRAISWHARNNIPVEINDSHHWSLRDASDAIAVADMYLSGIICKMLGVKNFIAQYMFNTPPSMSFDMDLAKILAKDELLKSLEDDSFHVIRQVRTGLASFPINLEKAKGQLAAATLIQLAIKPDIIHVVSFSEASHAASPTDVIESCNIVDQVIFQMYSSQINVINEKILKRKEELIDEAKYIIDLIPKMAKSNLEAKYPWINYKVLARIVRYGIFDAPQLRNNQFALGNVKTKIIDGACYSWDDLNQQILNEKERIDVIIQQNPEVFNTANKLNFETVKEEMIV